MYVCVGKGEGGVSWVCARAWLYVWLNICEPDECGDEIYYPSYSAQGDMGPQGDEGDRGESGDMGLSGDSVRNLHMLLRSSDHIVYMYMHR